MQYYSKKMFHLLAFLQLFSSVIYVQSIDFQFKNNSDCNKEDKIGIREKNIAKRRGRLIGGKDSGRLPFIVNILMFFSPTVNQCGGCIYNQLYVLTAAHCFDGHDVNNFNEADVLVRAGTVTLKEVGPHEQRRNASEIFLHDDYIPVYNQPDIALQLRHDLALLKVNVPFDFNEYVNFIYLAPTSMDEHLIREVCYTAGWGATNFPTPEYPNNLQMIYQLKWKLQEENQASLIFGHSSEGAGCRGDSGNPLVCEQGLVGIYSVGDMNCKIGLSVVYTDINYHSHKSWIQRHAGTQTEI